MAVRSETSIQVQSRDHRELPKTKATLVVVTWDKPERMQNALRTFGMWFAFTFAAVFIPLVHWVLVPTLLITSFVLAIDKLKETVRNEGGQGECPKCHQVFEVQASKWSDRLTDTCAHCHEDLELMVRPFGVLFKPEGDDFGSE